MDDLKPGDLLIMTQAYDEYVHQKNPQLKLVLTNRLAKLEDIIDWDTERGRLIKEAREKSGKWKDLPIEENKYLVSIFYPDITGRKGEQGVAERSIPLFRKHPKNGVPFFTKVPEWLYKELFRKCESFTVARKDV